MSLRDELRKLTIRWRGSRAHTYASENADHYRGFDAGQLRAAEDLEAVMPFIECHLTKGREEGFAEAQVAAWNQSVSRHHVECASQQEERTDDCDCITGKISEAIMRLRPGRAKFGGQK